MITADPNIDRFLLGLLAGCIISLSSSLIRFISIIAGLLLILIGIFRGIAGVENSVRTFVMDQLLPYRYFALGIASGYAAMSIIRRKP